VSIGTAVIDVVYTYMIRKNESEDEDEENDTRNQGNDTSKESRNIVDV
jgi:hypothetical protein